MPYQVYKVLHIFAVVMLFVSLGGLTLHAVNGGTKESNLGRKMVAISHGVAMIIILVAGFGLLARLQVMAAGIAFPLWVWLKLGIWVVMGALVAIPYRKPELARPLWLLLPVLGAVAAAVAIYKPA